MKLFSTGYGGDGYVNVTGLIDAVLYLGKLAYWAGFYFWCHSFLILYMVRVADTITTPCEDTPLITYFL